MYALNFNLISSISSLQLNSILFTIISAGLYFDTSSKVNKDKWLAYKGTFGTKYYYGESNGLGENLTTAFNTYSGRISDIVRTMI